MSVEKLPILVPPVIFGMLMGPVMIPARMVGDKIDNDF